jgi:hypothetical protein
LASVLDAKHIRKTDREVSTIFQDYVVDVGSIWQAAGLYPTRARNYQDPTYKSRFHRFTDLILTALAEPWTHRYDANLNEIRRRAFDARARMPDEFRRVSAALRQCDEGWLISDHILRQALRKLVKKQPLQTP